jgi:17beta-estradiol 17-dehydrogenase / very-long-chain 3-oxoacyl-CoA reductase
MDADVLFREQKSPWFVFVSLAILGVLYVAAVACRLLHISGLALCLRRPKDLRRRYGAWAVVTGPTSGIGRSMALELARLGLNLVLVGRDPAKLDDISRAVSEAHGVQAKTVLFDFSLVSTPQGEV